MSRAVRAGRRVDTDWARWLGAVLTLPEHLLRLGVLADTDALGVDALTMAAADFPSLPARARLLRAVLPGEAVEAPAVAVVLAHTVPRAEVRARLPTAVLTLPSRGAEALASIAKTVARARVGARLDLAHGAGEALVADCGGGGGGGGGGGDDGGEVVVMG